MQLRTRYQLCNARTLDRLWFQVLSMEFRKKFANSEQSSKTYAILGLVG